MKELCLLSGVFTAVIVSIAQPQDRAGGSLSHQQLRQVALELLQSGKAGLPTVTLDKGTLYYDLGGIGSKEREQGVPLLIALDTQIVVEAIRRISKFGNVWAPFLTKIESTVTNELLAINKIKDRRELLAKLAQYNKDTDELVAKGMAAVAKRQGIERAWVYAASPAPPPRHTVTFRLNPPANGTVFFLSELSYFAFKRMGQADVPANWTVQWREAAGKEDLGGTYRFRVRWTTDKGEKTYKSGKITIEKERELSFSPDNS